MTDLPAGFGLYVHWPFCLSKCPYCDFNSHVAPRIDHDRWRRAYVAQLRALCSGPLAATLAGRRVSSVYFGGGTPSLMDPAVAADLLAAIRSSWPTAEDVEVTLEANPSAAEVGRFAAFREAGINRLSLGIQSFDDRVLRFLGRAHDAAAARAAIAAAARTFPRFSFDLMYGWAGHDPHAWRRDLTDWRPLAHDHLSLYQLTVEPGTPFFAAGVAVADEDTAAALYETAGEVLGTAGLPAYEISNHARQGVECRHNLDVWRGGDFLPLGPGAHGRITASGTTWALAGDSDGNAWLAAVEAGETGLAVWEPLDRHARGEELVLLGLRLAEGIPWGRLDPFTASPSRREALQVRVADLADAGFLDVDRARIRATPAGRVRLDAVLRALLA